MLQDVADASPALLLDERADGRVKMFVMNRALGQRATLRDTFDRGSYVPLWVDGSHRDHVFAFARRDGESTTITCVPRLVGGLIGDRPTPPVGPDVWGDSRIMLPSPGDRDLRPPAFRNAMTGAVLEPRVDGDAVWLDVAAVLADFPVALLVPAD